LLVDLFESCDDVERGGWSVVGRGLVDHDQQRFSGRPRSTTLQSPRSNAKTRRS